MKNLDEKDQAIVLAILARRKNITTPKVGDWVGSSHRIASISGDKIQLSNGKFGWSFHLYKDGLGDFSGGLEPPIQSNTLADNGETREGSFWIFHHNVVGAHRGVHFKIPVSVWSILTGQ